MSTANGRPGRLATGNHRYANRDLTTGEVCAILGVAPRTVANWVDSGRLSGYRLPGGLDRRVSRAALKAFMRDAGMPAPPALGAQIMLLGPSSWAECLVPLLDGEACCPADVFEAGRICAAGWPFVAAVDLAWLGRQQALVVAAHLLVGNCPALAVYPEDQTPELAGVYAAALQGPVAMDELVATVNKMLRRQS